MLIGGTDFEIDAVELGVDDPEGKVVLLSGHEIWMQPDIRTFGLVRARFLRHEGPRHRMQEWRMFAVNSMLSEQDRGTGVKSHPALDGKAERFVGYCGSLIENVPSRTRWTIDIFIVRELDPLQPIKE